MGPLIYRLDCEDPEEIAELAASAIQNASVVALPTETVYGLFARGDERGRQALARVKGRDLAAKPLPFALADEEETQNFVNHLPWAARRLASHFWPGPLSLVLGPPPAVALRLPDQEFTRSVLRRVPGLVHATSANPSGAAPATSAPEVARLFQSGVELIVDAGPSPLGLPSTLVSVPPSGPWSLLREGVISAAELEEILSMNVLVVCTGNTCRSPMAEAIFKDSIEKRLAPGNNEKRLRVSSAGIYASEGSPMSPGAREALAEIGVDGSAHRSRPLSTEMLDQSDLILCLTPEHRYAIEALGAHRGDLELLDPGGSGIDDPFGSSLEVYRRVLDQIRRAVEERLEPLANRVGLKPHQK